MAEKKGKTSNRHLTVRHRGRISQIGIYFIKFLRMFVYQGDWIVLPMAALIGGLVGFVISSYFMVTMEGTMTGAFVLVCICVWNGSFNSIQVVCREREIVKREHRGGMHISSYIIAHMLYQLFLCLLQTIVTLGITYLVKMKYPTQGLFTDWFFVDFGITILLITYAADMLSLWISTLARNTTIAMTIMPFVLVFQLIFSGGMIPLPVIAKPVTQFTVACPGFNAMASQADTNSKPYASTSTMLRQMEDLDFEVTVTMGQVLNFLQDTDNESIVKIREKEVGSIITIGDILQEVRTNEQFSDLREEILIYNLSIGRIVELMENADFMDKYRDREIGGTRTIGEIVDYLADDPSAEDFRKEEVVIRTTVGKAMDLMGKKDIQRQIREKTTKMNYHSEYEYTRENVMKNWAHLLLFVLAFSVLAIITLEFVDKDKR